VDRDLLVDIDETGVWMACCRRTRGHAPRGESATTHSPYNVGKKYTVILAIDTGGLICYQIADVKGTSGEMFLAFLTGGLMPCIEGTSRRLVMDNASSHKTDDVKRCIRAYGHGVTYRPPLSSDVLGSIEYAMNVIKAHLRRNSGRIVEDNLPDFIEAAVCSLTPEQCRGFFEHTGH
jgi:transposase